MRWVTLLLLAAFCLNTSFGVERVIRDSNDFDSAFMDRPDTDKPTEVAFFIFVLNVSLINGSQQYFEANVYLDLEWKDERLAHSGTSLKSIPVEKAWTPRVIIANQKGFLPTSMPEELDVAPDGSVTYRQRYVGPFAQPLKLSNFPFDDHKFTIHFTSTEYTPEELTFIPQEDEKATYMSGGGMSEKLSIPNWYVEKYDAKNLPYNPLPGTKMAGFGFAFTAKRYRLYYILHVIIPLVFIVMMSWVAFWIDPTHPGAQITAATSSMLTIIAYRFMLGNLIPKLPYMTRMDYFIFGSTTLVFFTIVEVAATTVLAYKKKEILARKLDKLSRYVFPAAFIVWAIWSLV